MARGGGNKINKLKNPEEYKVAIYIRTGKKIDGLDVVRFQKDRVEEYCDDLKLKVIETYIDDGIDIFAKNRPAFNKLIEDVKSGNINLIVTANFARIARSQKEMIDILELQKKYNFRTLFADSREELIKDRLGVNLRDYMENEDTGLDELDDEAYEDEDMEF